MRKEMFKFNEVTLEYEVYKPNNYINKIMLGMLSVLAFIMLTGTAPNNTVVQSSINQYEQPINVITTIELNHSNLLAEIKKYNFKYPDIVYAQAILESNNFKSNIYKENNNLFGMREAKQRTTTATGTENNHASYKNWQDSVTDRALFETSFLRTIQSKEQYFAYIGRNYAEAGNYVEQLKKIINKNKNK